MGKKVMIPLELKYDFALTAYSGLYKGFMYAIREECGAATTMKVYERLCNMGDRIKNLTNFFLTTFKIAGNDTDAMSKWFDIYFELMGFESTVLEKSKTFMRSKITKCPMKTKYNDIRSHCVIWSDIVHKTINPKATVERPKGMCAGDPYCEFITKIEE